MRIWDIDAGFLNDQSLLGEHRELHGIFSIITNNKTGYARHPETRRWVGSLAGLARRHALLVAEMTLRGFKHHSPLPAGMGADAWPRTYIDQPGRQYRILAEKYADKKAGRIPLPKNPQELWARHKYSVMARNYPLYKKTGARVADNALSFDDLALALVQCLRSAPPANSLQNAIQHMWGYVSDYAATGPAAKTADMLLGEIQALAAGHDITYLRSSTALGELAGWD